MPTGQNTTSKKEKIYFLICTLCKAHISFKTKKKKFEFGCNVIVVKQGPECHGFRKRVYLGFFNWEPSNDRLVKGLLPFEPF